MGYVAMDRINDMVILEVDGITRKTDFAIYERRAGFCKIVLYNPPTVEYHPSKDWKNIEPFNY